MTAVAHQHTCAQVDRLEDEVRDQQKSLIAYANDHLRMVAVVQTAQHLAATWKQPLSEDADAEVSRAEQALAAAVAATEEPHIHPSDLADRIRQAIGDPGSVLPRDMGPNGRGPAESYTDWQQRAVLHVLTHPPAKAVNSR